MAGRPPTVVGASRFGGHPDVPAGFDWPVHARGTHRFLGQIDLADLPRPAADLPSNGLLSLFVAADEGGFNVASDPGYARAYLFRPGQQLDRRDAPDVLSVGPSSGIRFEAGVDLPTQPWWDDAAMQRWPLAESDADAYQHLRHLLHPADRYLLGFPLNMTMAYDPTPGPAWTSLLTLGSDDELGWCWADGDRLVTFVEVDRLRAGDLSDVRADAG